MSANERRAEIIKILKHRQQEQISVLASELQVSVRTIKYDIEELKKEYPLETMRGNGGGVCLQLNNNLYNGRFTEIQQNAIIAAMKAVSQPLARILGDLLRIYGSRRNKAKIEAALDEMI